MGVGFLFVRRLGMIKWFCDICGEEIARISYIRGYAINVAQIFGALQLESLLRRSWNESAGKGVVQTEYQLYHCGTFSYQCFDMGLCLSLG